MRLAIVTSQAFSLVNFRGSLIRTLAAEGAEVLAFAPDYCDEIRTEIRAMGGTPVDFACQRASISPWRDAIDAIRLSYLLRKLKPDSTLCYFIKPAIFGTLAAWVARVPHRAVMIEGLGYVFVNGRRPDLRRRALRCVVMLLYRASVKRAQNIVVLNRDDLNELCRWGGLQGDKALLLPGIGVDIDYFRPALSLPERTTFILVARMLRSKGIEDFVASARIVKARFPSTRFILAGSTDANPDSIAPETLSGWNREGVVEWLGHVGDVRIPIAESSVFVLPSYYREGLPRSIQEAMAMGKPIITTDVPGCRDTVIEGGNGFIVPPQNPEALAAAMCRFLESPELIGKMGYASRRMAELHYDEREINRRLIDMIYAGSMMCESSR